MKLQLVSIALLAILLPVSCRLGATKRATRPRVDSNHLPLKLL